MPNDYANFNEVLQVTVDTPAFKQGLDQIAELYQQFKTSLEGQDIGALLQVGSFTGIVEALNAVKATIIETSTEGIQSFQSLGIEISAVLEQIKREDAELAAAREKISASAKSGSVQFDKEPLAYAQGDNKAEVERLRAIETEKKAQSTAFNESLGGQLLQVGKLLLMWQAVGLAVEAVSAVLSAPFVALKSGVEYLKQTEKAATDLSGVINENIQFSKDFNTQLLKSRDGAVDVVKAFQDIAIKDNVKFDDLVRIFKSFSEAGGAGTVKTLNEMVTATEYFAVVLKASGASANSVRSAVSDIPKFLNGTLAPTSKFLEVLKLSPAAAKELAAEIKVNKDLVEQLAPRVQKYIDATVLASDTNEQLAAKVALIKSRLEALAAGPIFTTINAYLKDALSFLTRHKDKIEEIAVAFGELANNLAQNIIPLLGQMLPLLTPVGIVFAGIAFTITTATNGLRLMVDLIKATAGVLDPTEKTLEKLADSEKRFVDQDIKNTAAYQNAVRAATGTATKAEPFVGPSQQDAGSSKISDPNKHPSLDKGKKPKSNTSNDREDYRDDLADVKAAYAEARESIQESLKARVISQQTASKQIIEALDSEKAALVAVASAQKDRINNDTATTKPEKQRLLKSVDRDLLNSNTSLNKEESRAIQAANSEVEAIRAEGVKSVLDLEKAKRAGLLAVYHEEFQDGLISARSLLDQEIAESEETYRVRLEINEKELGIVTAGSLHEAKLKADQLLLLQDSSNARDVLSLKSSALDEGVARKKREHALELGLIANEQRTIEIQANELVTGSRNILEETFVLRQQDIDAKRKEIQIELQLAQAKLAGGEAAKAASRALAQNTTETLANIAAQLQAIRGSSDPKLVQDIRIKNLQRTAIASATADVSKAEDKLGKAVIGDATNEEIQIFVDELKAANVKLKAVTDELKPQDLEGALSNLQKQLFGFDLTDALDKAHGSVEKLGLYAEAAGGAISLITSSITSAIQAYSQGQKEGGTAGGIGALLQSGPVSKLAALGGPIVSGIVQGVGSALSFVGALFTAQAAKIAGEIKKSFDTTIKAFQQGSATIGQTLDAVTKERSDAISRLSGIKDGKEQLAKLLPSFDDEIASLKNQQKSILLAFDESLGALVLKTNTFNDALSGAYTNWVAINKQVQDYVNAGGDAAKAAQFLSLSLKDIELKNQESLNQGQQEAIATAIHLNDLLTQKIDLERQYNQQVFALQNSDSIERANNGAVSKAQQLQAAQLSNQRQIANLNNEISLTTQKLTAEKTIFSVATDITELHRQDDLLTLASLDLQLAKYASIKDILKSITTDANGITSLNSGVFGSQGVTVGTINVNIQTPGGTIVSADTGKAVANSVYAELHTLQRQGS